MSTTTLGLIAGGLTTAAWLPQIARIWRLRRAEELSWGYLVVFGVGACLWLTYGFMESALAIILANVVTIALLSSLIILKLTTQLHAASLTGSTTGDD
jgi:MtN3 and saliva related transmembrane protein